MKPIKMKMEGYEVVEKKTKKGGNSGRIYVPKHWIGKKVRAVLVEKNKEKEKKKSIKKKMKHKIILIFAMIFISPISFALEPGKLYINDVFIPFEVEEKVEEPEEATSTFYIYANGQRIAKKTNNKLYYFYNDHLGSPRSISDDQGNIIWKADYKPFGEAFNELNSNNKINYNSKEKDIDTKLHYYGARYYLDGIGRFITADSVEVHPNAYVYTANNPLKFVDPSGNQLKFIKENIRPIIVSSALATLSYNLIKKENPLSNYPGLISLGIIAGNAVYATGQMIHSINMLESVKEYTSTIGFENRITSISEYILNPIRETDPQVANRLKEIVKKGRFFLINEQESLMVGKFQFPEKATGFYMPVLDMIFIRNLHGLDIEEGSKAKKSLLQEYAPLIGHEAKHSTQGLGRDWLNNFFGFGYYSKLHLKEQPARIFERNVEGKLSWDEQIERDKKFLEKMRKIKLNLIHNPIPIK